MVWSNEDADVLLLRLVSEISEQYAPLFLGWNASTFPEAPPENGEYGLVHYSSADSKKLTRTTRALRPMTWKTTNDITHVLSQWTQGVTEEGSSGAALVDCSPSSDGCKAVGVLTGGPNPTTCRNGQDILGTLYAAWMNGLDAVLSPSSSSSPSNATTNASMDSWRPVSADGPGILATPSEILLKERSRPVVALKVALSDPPGLPDEVMVMEVQLVVPVALRQQEANISLTSPTRLNFTAATWNRTQSISILSGNDDVAVGPLPFQIVLDLFSSVNPNFYRKRVLKGLRIDQEVAPVLTLDDPGVILGG